MTKNDNDVDTTMARVRAARAGHAPACGCRLCVLGTATEALLRMLRDLDRHVDRADVDLAYQRGVEHGSAQTSADYRGDADPGLPGHGL